MVYNLLTHSKAVVFLKDLEKSKYSFENPRSSSVIFTLQITHKNVIDIKNNKSSFFKAIFVHFDFIFKFTLLKLRDFEY